MSAGHATIKQILTFDTMLYCTNSRRNPTIPIGVLLHSTSPAAYATVIYHLYGAYQFCTRNEFSTTRERIQKLIYQFTHILWVSVVSLRDQSLSEKHGGFSGSDKLETRKEQSYLCITSWSKCSHV